MHFRTVLAALTALTLNASLIAQNKSKPSDSKSPESRPSETRSSQKDVRPAGIWYGIENARPKQQGALRLAAYNAENLFDDFDDPSLSGEYDDINEKTSEERLKAVAAAIRKLDADVLCLEEIESKRCLEWFRDKYLKDMGYEFVASEDVGYYRGVEQSVLSRVPITSVSIFKGDDAIVTDMESRRNADSAKRLGGEWAAPSKGAPQDHFQRSPLRVSFKTKDGYEFTVFVCHFKAGGKDFAQQRELEALQTEAFVGEELKKNPDANIAVVGDYNATPNDMATKSLRMSELGLVSAYDWRFDKDAPKETYTTHASARVIDYVVMTPGLAADCVPSSFFVLGTLHAASDWDFKKADTIPPPAGYASDHCPIAIDLMPTPGERVLEGQAEVRGEEGRHRCEACGVARARGWQECAGGRCGYGEQTSGVGMDLCDARAKEQDCGVGQQEHQVDLVPGLLEECGRRDECCSADGGRRVQGRWRVEAEVEGWRLAEGAEFCGVALLEGRRHQP